MTKADAARALRARAALRGITAARSQEEFDDDDRLLDAYLRCIDCDALHLTPTQRQGLIRRARDLDHVMQSRWRWCRCRPSAHGSQGGPPDI